MPAPPPDSRTSFFASDAQDGVAIEAAEPVGDLDREVARVAAPAQAHLVALVELELAVARQVLAVVHAGRVDRRVVDRVRDQLVGDEHRHRRDARALAARAHLLGELRRRSCGALARRG